MLFFGACWLLSIVCATARHDAPYGTEAYRNGIIRQTIAIQEISQMQRKDLAKQALEPVDGEEEAAFKQAMSMQDDALQQQHDVLRRAASQYFNRNN